MVTPPAPASNAGRFIVVAELRSTAAGRFEATLAQFFQNVRLSQPVWLLRADGTTIGTIHNTLLPKLGQRDSLFIAEAGTGRTTAFNWGPEVEARVRALWKA
jgi:hypothetical protein